jgi:predicted nucleic acid-binding protein
LLLPDLVVSELANRGLSPQRLDADGVQVETATVATGEWQAILRETKPAQIQPADAQVFALAQSAGFRLLVLTDDLALRRRLEQNGASVVGSVGVLVRAYRSGRIDRRDLEHSIEALIETSSLHLSRAFRSYIRQLLVEMP